MSKHLEHDWFPDPLPDNVVMGDRSWLYSTFAFRHYYSRQPEGLTVGNDTGLYNGTFFNLGPEARLTIGNYCTVVGAIFCTNARVVVGDYSLIAHDVVIADDAAASPIWNEQKTHSRAESPCSESGDSVIIGANAWIATRAVLLRGARIGEGAIVGAAAVVDFEVPPFAIVAGNPARIVKRLSNHS